MIPKKIHYVWFGGEKPDKVKKCINSWKELGKDWEIIEWNEKNIDINSHPFLQYHYKKRNWAFVSDYLRGWTIFNHGGIYVDTDIEYKGNKKYLNEIVDKYDFVFSRNGKYWITASSMGAKKGNAIVGRYVEIYGNDYIIKHQPTSGEQLAYSLREKEQYNYSIDSQELQGGILLDEKYLQIAFDNENISVHHHFANWDGKAKSLETSKYYFDKLKRREGNSEEVSNLIKLEKRFKMFDKNIKH